MVVLELKRAWSDGTTGFVFSPSELVGRLASLVPAPRTNTVVYHGVLAANAHLRSRVVASARGPRREPSGEEGEIRLSRPDRLARGRSRWTPWADLLHRVFGVAGWRCPNPTISFESLRASLSLSPTGQWRAPKEWVKATDIHEVGGRGPYGGWCCERW